MGKSHSKPSEKKRCSKYLQAATNYEQTRSSYYADEEDREDEDSKRNFSYKSSGSYECQESSYKSELRKHLHLLTHLEDNLRSFSHQLNDLTVRNQVANCCSQVAKRLRAVLQTFSVPHDDKQAIDSVVFMCDSLERIIRYDLNFRQIESWSQEYYALALVANEAADDLHQTYGLLKYSVASAWSRACRFFKRISKGFITALNILSAVTTVTAFALTYVPIFY